jgi:hypothetical protein
MIQTFPHLHVNKTRLPLLYEARELAQDPTQHARQNMTISFS